jgi:Na+/H+ antiporter NhaD/arsenite permease-like protein
MEHTPLAVSPWMILPFVALLLAVATMPFVNGKWWEHNYRYVAVGLGLVSAGYYILGLGAIGRVLHTLHEYLSFIAVIGSLFVAAGGIHIRIRGRSTPAENVLILLVGGVLANIIGTTGASMLLIRPYLRHNKYRLSAFHVVFFIFLVSNVGGALTPIGDPPLFLGFIKGIPFFWVTGHVFLPWMLAFGLILGVFYLLDLKNFRRVRQELRAAVKAEHDPTEISGLWNLAFIGIILGAVFIEDPPFLREGLMFGAAVASYLTTSKGIHSRNHFTFHPIQEVGWLFVGIFLTMMPALDWLTVHAAGAGPMTPGAFFWSTGLLSGVLDNAPTYLTFLTAALGASGGSIDNVADVHRFLAGSPMIVAAVSVASVFFGAMTYIGNGPNFMVRSIAERSGARVPGFFGYIGRYSVPVLLPVFIIVWLIFFS